MAKRNFEGTHDGQTFRCASDLSLTHLLIRKQADNTWILVSGHINETNAVIHRGFEKNIEIIRCKRVKAGGKSPAATTGVRIG